MSGTRPTSVKGKQVLCDLCTHPFSERGYRNHRLACARRAGAAPRGSLLTATHGGYGPTDNIYDPLGASSSESRIPLNFQEDPTDPYDPLGGLDIPRADSRAASTLEINDQSLVAEHFSPPQYDSIYETFHPQEQPSDEQLGRGPQLDDIKVEPHPRNASRKRTRYYPYEKYTTDLPKPKRSKAPQPSTGSNDSHDGSLPDYSTPKSPLDGHDKPWAPFQTQLDFEFARLLQSAHLKESQVDDIINMVWKIVNSSAGAFTLHDGREVRETWKIASDLYGQGLENVDIQAKYKKEVISFPLWRVSLWNWCQSLLDDPILRDEFRWDAEKLFRHNGEEFERFINEPWTANRWWEVQSLLPQSDDKPAAPFCIIFYADKTKLSTMGTKKGYPVYVRCANLPSHIRNSEGLGGGRMVGLLPIVPEDNDESGKKPFVDFKRVVWHACVAEILESLRQFCAFGYPFECSDGIIRWLYPIILILSGDFEEQCVMAAIRGNGSAFPCPICLAPGEEFPALEGGAEIRTTEKMRAVLKEAEKAPTAKEREEDLKAVGLRRVKNAFWALEYTDVYLALSWDRLHAYHSGLFRKHILKEFLLILEDPAMGNGAKRRALSTEFEKNLQAMPRWRDFPHFTHISDFNEYCDGRKYEDLSKIIIFASHSIFPPSNERAYQWLALARSYLDLDMWSSLRTHTSTTILRGRQELQRFDRERQLYMDIHPDKMWDFPKAHSHAHLFDDIESKGSTVNFNTKYNEKKHKEQKEKYGLTNFKDVEKQIARLTHEEVASMIISRNVGQYELNQERLKLLDEAVEDDLDGLDDIDDVDWVHTGSPSTVQLLQAGDVVPSEYAQAFENLAAKLTRKMRYDLEIPRERKWSVSQDAVVTSYKLVKANYTSIEDSELTTDFIRVNPSFHNRARYDCALFAAGNDQHGRPRYTIGRIVSVLGILDHNNIECKYAVVIPFDRPLSFTREEQENTNRGAHLRFTRLRSREPKHSIVVAIKYILRGALMVQDWGAKRKDHFIVMDAVDADFFLRMRLQGLGTSLVSDGSLT